MAAMRNWIQRLDEDQDDNVEKKGKTRVAVIHCKAGKGRSGTAVCSYLLSEEGWRKEDALQRFTSRRMRPGFGPGVSIPSQLRWVSYVDRWTNSMEKKYVERPVEIVEIHIWGLRDGVKVAIQGFVENGRQIRTFHTFTREEKTVVDQGPITTKPAAPVESGHVVKDNEIVTRHVDGTPESSTNSLSNTLTGSTQAIILKPASAVILPSSDVNIDLERRNKAGYTGFTMVTSIARVWFNPHFEGGYEGHDSGVFEIEWEAMDGIKGSSKKGTKALDRLKVVWKYVKAEGGQAPVERVMTEPAKGEPVPENEPADWRGEAVDQETQFPDDVSSGRPGHASSMMGTIVNQGANFLGKQLGLRETSPDSADISQASSVKGDVQENNPNCTGDEIEPEVADEGVKSCGPEGEPYVSYGGVDDDAVNGK